MALPRALLVFLSSLTSYCVLIDATNVTVSTSVGDFIGLRKTVTVDGSSVQLSTFFGIPYAEPPVGDLRFRKPVPKAPLTSPMVAHVHGSECIQVQLGYPRTVTEDCLFLNIYAPEKLPNQDYLPVMIFIHGGGFVAGSSNYYISDMLATRGREKFTEWEKQLSRRMMTMWSNFAKTGNPKSPRDAGVDWLPYNTTHHNYLEIGRFENQTETKQRLFEARAHLWNKELPKINAETVTNICDTNEISGSESSLKSGIVSILVGTTLMVKITLM